MCPNTLPQIVPLCLSFIFRMSLVYYMSWKQMQLRLWTDFLDRLKLKI